MTVTYFAYGSNMAPAVMSRLCPGHRYLGRARLAGYRLAFTRRSRKTGTGVADVVARAGSEVWGAAYEISDLDLRAIDRKEGVDWAYTRVVLPVTLDSEGTERTATVYTVVTKEPTAIAPSRAYLNGMVSAARARGLPDDYVTWLAATRTADQLPDGPGG
jgi:gamma-glutamylcyclotransferase